MLHHVSFNARDPRHVACVLADLLGAVPVLAPSPPFPAASWLVCFGDEAGSFLEILPWGSVLDPDAPFGIGRDEAMRPRSGAHVLAGTPHSADEAQRAADRAGWRSEIVDARLFKVVKVWVENACPVELLPPEFAATYRATFGADGLPALDGKLRALEAGLLAAAAARAGPPAPPKRRRSECALWRL